MSTPIARSRSSSGSRSSSSSRDGSLCDGLLPNSSPTPSISGGNDTLILQFPIFFSVSNNQEDSNDSEAIQDLPEDASEADDPEALDSPPHPAEDSFLWINDSLGGTFTQVADIGGSFDSLSRDPAKPDVPQDSLDDDEIGHRPDNVTQFFPFPTDLLQDFHDSNSGSGESVNSALPQMIDTQAN
ncbi:hypothetical protein BCR39DRAFT_514231 [Naematelia encephala]|uniref:Uncharacterized protein n=1 Tax=Naematelia encephala TaxID=71784 RepID=A0A1Y2BIZ3_9TREE|nr:hypothetical protein BCR39DRAFT_514231 [Naematelia encephala]